jgi:ech hydrogenase subunit F
MPDYPMVMCKTVVRSLISRSACKMYPAREPIFFERTRGRIEMAAVKCILCTLCAKRCPTGAIIVDREKNIWQIDRFKCILCGNCIEGCKSEALKMANHYTGPTVAKQGEGHRVVPPKAKKEKTEQ